MVVRIRPPTCGLPVMIHEYVVYQDPTGCLTAFRFSPFEVRDDSNPSGDGLSHLNRAKLGGAATGVLLRFILSSNSIAVHRFVRPHFVINTVLIATSLFLLVFSVALAGISLLGEVIRVTRVITNGAVV